MAENNTIIFRMGEETGIVVEKTQEQFEQSLFKEQYRQALTLINSIISGSKDADKDAPMSNIVAFCGDRGEGKTSAMMTIRNILIGGDSFEVAKNTELFPSDNKIEKNSFKVLRLIDPAFFDNKHNLLELLLGQMYADVREADKDCKPEEMYSGNFNKNIADRNTLMTKFQDVKRSLAIIHKASDKNAYDSLEEIDELAAGIELKEDVNKLMLCYAKYFGKDRVLISIDDLDLNVTEGYLMAEEIRKYLSSPEACIVLMSIKVEQMIEVVQSYLRESMSQIIPNDTIKEMAIKYVTKLIPQNRRIQMPSGEEIVERPLKFEDDKETIEPYPLVKESVAQLIFQKTGYVFYNAQSVSPIVPTNLRELRHLLVTLENLPDARDAEWNDNETGRDVFKDYFYETWAAKLPRADYEFAQKLAFYRDISSFNAFIVEYFTKRVKEAGIELVKDEKNVGYEQLYMNISERMNTASNISCGDVMFILWFVNSMSVNTDIQNLIFLIKTTYSIRLYECYNNISINEDSLYIPTNDVEEVVSIHKADGLYEHVNKMQRFVNGSFFTYPPKVLLRSEENISPRDRRVVQLNPISNFVKGLCEDYNPEEPKQTQEFTQKLQMCEYLALCLSRTTTNKEKEDIGLNRKEKLPTYLGSLQSSAQYAIFDFLNPFYSFCNIQYAYQRFDAIISKKDSSATPLYQMALNTKDSLLWQFYALEENQKPTWKGIHSFISDAIIRISDVQWSIFDELLRTRDIHKDGNAAIADAYGDITNLMIKLYPLKRKDGSGEPHILRFKCLTILKKYLERDGVIETLSKLLKTSSQKEEYRSKAEMILAISNKLATLSYPRTGHSITTQVSNVAFPESKTKRKMLKNELMKETFVKQQQYQYKEVTDKFDDIFVNYLKVALQ